MSVNWGMDQNDIASGVLQRGAVAQLGEQRTCNA